MRRIIIQSTSKPKGKKVKEDVKWICSSLGLMRGRDVENISFKVMYELLSSFSGEELISTDDLSKSLKLESPRINHHIRSLMNSGILLRERRKISLRGGSLSSALEEMKRDSEIMFNRLLEVSKKIDEAFDLG